MQSILKTRASKLLSAAALAGLLGVGSQAYGSLAIDVRLANNSKAVTILPGDSVTVNVYLQSSDPANDLPNGLGSFGLGVLSKNETFGSPNLQPGTPWDVNRTPTSTVVNASGGTNATPTSIFDLGYSAGTNTDSTAISGNPDLNDTDLDRTGLSGTQSAGGGWDVTVGKVSEYLLGTATFTALAQDAAGKAYNQTVELNAIFSGANGPGGGAVIKSLTGSDTTTNGVSGTNLITSASQINAPVLVTVAVPEPASLGLLGLASFGLLGRRRRA